MSRPRPANSSRSSRIATALPHRQTGLQSRRYRAAAQVRLPRRGHLIRSVQHCRPSACWPMSFCHSSGASGQPDNQGFRGLEGAAGGYAVSVGVAVDELDGVAQGASTRGVEALEGQIALLAARSAGSPSRSESASQRARGRIVQHAELLVANLFRSHPEVPQLREWSRGGHLPRSQRGHDRVARASACARSAASSIAPARDASQQIRFRGVSRSSSSTLS